MVRKLLGLVLSLATVAVGLTAPASATETVEAYVWPSGGDLRIEGHGYGHGHGMSQWGARGAARSGLSYGAILSHYYRGTSLATRTSGWIRVWSTGAGSSATTVVAEDGLTFTTAESTITLPEAIAGYGTASRWRVVRDGSSLTLQAWAGTAWRAVTTEDGPTLAPPVLFSAPDGIIGEVQGTTTREHRGKIRAVLDGTAVRTVVVIPLEEYLRSVVPSEMPSSWDAAALRSQAVAARTYASWERATATGWRDTCDTTQCQVYRGAATISADGSRTSREAASTDAAISTTAGRILEYGGSPAFTQFSASNGGWAVAGSRPYLRAFEDPYDGVVPSTAHSWTASVSDTKLEATYPTLGQIVGLRVLARDGNGRWGGRVTSLELVGSAGAVTLTGAAFRSATGIRSTWWHPAIGTASGSARDYDGDRYPDLLGTRDDGTLWLYSGNGIGGFRSHEQIGHGWGSTNLVPVGDLDGDGLADIVAWTPDGVLWLFPGTGAGWFRNRTQIGHGWRSVQALTGVGDLDGDGNDDLVATFTDGTLWLFPGTGRGWFLPKRPIGHGWGNVTTLVGPGDFDGDGNVDVIAREENGRLWLYRGNGRGWFSRTDPIGTGWGGIANMFSPGDWNGDGWPDVLATYPAGTMRIFPGNGRGWFGSSLEISSGWDDFRSVR